MIITWIQAWNFFRRVCVTLIQRTSEISYWTNFNRSSRFGAAQILSPNLRSSTLYKYNFHFRGRTDLDQHSTHCSQPPRSRRNRLQQFRLDRFSYFCKGGLVTAADRQTYGPRTLPMKSVGISRRSRVLYWLRCGTKTIIDPAMHLPCIKLT